MSKADERNEIACAYDGWRNGDTYRGHDHAVFGAGYLAAKCAYLNEKPHEPPADDDDDYCDYCGKKDCYQRGREGHRSPGASPPHAALIKKLGMWRELRDGETHPQDWPTVWNEAVNNMHEAAKIIAALSINAGSAEGRASSVGGNEANRSYAEEPTGSKVSASRVSSLDPASPPHAAAEPEKPMKPKLRRLLTMHAVDAQVSDFADLQDAYKALYASPSAQPIAREVRNEIVAWWTDHHENSLLFNRLMRLDSTLAAEMTVALKRRCGWPTRAS